MQNINEIIAYLILKRAQELIKNQEVPFCEQLPETPDQCRNIDFIHLSSMTDISKSTLKRLFNPQNKNYSCYGLNVSKIAHFLELNQ